MDEFLDYVKIIGGILGIIAFFWKVIDSLNSYLQISIKIEEDKNGELSIRTAISNKSVLPKDIKNAFVIISPENESVVKSAEIIRTTFSKEITNHIDKQFTCTNDFEVLKINEPKYLDNMYAYIPLSFYFLENVSIGDENLSYRASINKKELNSGIYSARLFIFHKTRLHRTTQDLFRIK